MNDTELKQLLAKMLPGMVAEDSEWGEGFVLRMQGTGRRVLDTELLHLCRLVEAGLGEKNIRSYAFTLAQVLDTSPTVDLDDQFRNITASWQQRTQALAKVKGLIP